jgi:hypothetical protein
LIDCPHCFETNPVNNQYCKSCGKLINLEIRKNLPPIAHTNIYLIFILLTYSIFIFSYLLFNANDIRSFYLNIFITLINGILGAVFLSIFLIKSTEISYSKFYPQLHELVLFFGISQGIFYLISELINTSNLEEIFLETAVLSITFAFIYLLGFYVIFWVMNSKVVLYRMKKELKIEEIED